MYTRNSSKVFASATLDLMHRRFEARASKAWATLPASIYWPLWIGATAAFCPLFLMCACAITYTGQPDAKVDILDRTLAAKRHRTSGVTTKWDSTNADTQQTGHTASTNAAGADLASPVHKVQARALLRFATVLLMYTKVRAKHLTVNSSIYQ